MLISSSYLLAREEKRDAVSAARDDVVAMYADVLTFA
jgi:hypothetical protein